MCPGAQSHIRASGASKFPNPFFDIASEYIPRDLNVLFELSEYIYMSFGLMRSASQRVVRYFLTDIILEGGHETDRQDFDKFLKKDLRLTDVMGQIGDDRIVYGNSFSSLFMPFDRYLYCSGCHTYYRADKIKYQFRLPDTRFTGHCAKCKRSVSFHVEDRKSWDRSRLKIVRWNPKNIRLKHNSISGRNEYYLRMDQKLFRQLESGDPFYINDTPLPILQWASRCRAGTHDVYFGFDPREIYHMCEPTLAGLPIVGWGIPPMLPNLRLAYYIQLLRRYDEAIALDFIVPFRVLFPKVSVPAGSSMDPIMVTNLSKYRSHLQEMVDNKRKDPTWGLKGRLRRGDTLFTGRDSKRPVRKSYHRA